MKKQDKGFTLVELLIVIVILGILATVTVFAVRGITDRGQQNACDVEARAIQTAIEAYFVENDQNDPGGFGDLVPAYITEDPSARWDATAIFARTPVSIDAAADGLTTCAP
ncbi:MAG: type II secretion system protein [Actinomycetota bacterium]